jgi:hypothetical protein
MGTTTPNISLYIPADGETNYGTAFANGMLNLDSHDHSGAPDNGVQLSSAGIADGSITAAKLNANVLQAGGGLEFDTLPGDPIQVVSILRSIVGIGSNGIIFRNSSTTVSVVNPTVTGNVLISQASATPIFTPHLFVDPNGLIRLDAQPRFLAYLDTTLTNQTGNGTTVTLSLANTTINVGSLYDTGTGKFTIPVGGAGDYRFDATIGLSAVPSDATNGILFIQRFNSSNVLQEEYAFRNNTFNTYSAGASPDATTMNISAIMTCADSDYVVVAVSVAGHATATISILGKDASPTQWTTFSGELISIA